LKKIKVSNLKTVVSGMGGLCALGENFGRIWESIEQGKLGISEIKRFDVSSYRTSLGAMVENDNRVEDDVSLLMSYGSKAAREALDNANITDLSKVSLAIGISNSILGHEINIIAKLIAEDLGIGGFVYTISTACASSAHAIGIGMDLIRSGKADIILCGGVDLLNEDVFAGFTSLSLLSEKPCAPFSTQMGTTLGEGAAFLVLENEASSRDRKVHPVAICRGFGHAGDGYHDTSPDPKGLGMARAITSALIDADLEPRDIDYINAHGTGTQANDAAEWRAIKKVFQDYADQLPVSSSKSFLGHTQGVAGVMEVAVSMMAMNKGVITPTRNLESSRPFSPVDPVKGKYPRKHLVNHFLSTNAAFGGVNTALIFSRYKETAEQGNKITEEKKIGIALASIVEDTKPVAGIVPFSELRTMDKTALLISSSIAGIFEKLKFQPRSKECKDIGLYVGQTKVSPQSLAAFRKSIEVLGYKNLSAHAFTKMVVNYATGAAGRIFGLKGPTVTISTEADSGFAAMLFAANHMLCHPEINNLIAAGVDEADEDRSYPDRSASVFLTKGTNSAFYLKAWSISKQLEDSIFSALNDSGYSLNDVERIDVNGGSSSSGLFVVNTILNERKNEKIKPVLLCQQNSGNAAMAMIIEKNMEYES
jgi:3-oxoacyl-[acyl-carrier-protein] synthase II